MLCEQFGCLGEGSEDQQQQQQRTHVEIVEAEEARADELQLPDTKVSVAVQSSLGKASELVTRADLDKVRDELNAKFVELQQKVLQSDAHPVETSIEREHLGDEERDEEKPCADLADEHLALKFQLKEIMHEHDCYKFDESTWDATMFAFIYPLRFMDSFFTLLISALNIALQVMFCLLIQMEFTQSDDYEKAGREWRKMNGHWQKYANDVGTSLAARVCENDLSIELSGAQLMMYQLANGYISDAFPFLKDTIGSPFSPKVGPLLCFLCLLIWYLSSVWSEIFRCWCFFKALLALPRAPRSSLRVVEQGFAITQVSTERLTLITMQTLLRLGIACLLFYSGSVWLAATSEPREMVLNAAALTFVLDIDNIVCQCMAPKRVLCVLQNTKAVRTKYRRLAISTAPSRAATAATHGLFKLCLHLPWHALLCMISMLTVTVFNFRGHVLPQYYQLDMAADAFCSEPTNFVVDTHGATGIIFSWKQLQEDGGVPADSLMTQVVEETIKLGSSKNSLVLSSWLDFRTAVALPLEDFIGTYGVCQDFKLDQQYLKAPLQRAVGKILLASCSELSEEDCMAPDPIVRFACPVTCGCASPYSGFFMLEGCPITNCQELNPDAWQIWRSEDIVPMVLNVLPRWHSYWLSYVRVMEAQDGAENVLADMSAQAIRDRFIELGCNAIANISKEIHDAPAALNYFCTASSKRRSLQPFCPKQCVCSAGDQNRFCPTREINSASLCAELVVSQAFIVDCGGYLPHGHNALGAYTCIAKGYNRKNLYRRFDSVGVIWEIRWETEENFDWGGFFAGNKIGLNGTAKWTLRSLYTSPVKGGPLQKAMHYFSAGGLQRHPSNDWMPRTMNNTDVTCATGAMGIILYLGYHVLERSSLSCQEGTSAVDDESTCRHAAGGWGAQRLLYLGVVNSAVDPPGCIINLEGTASVQFNEYPYGKRGGSWHPVCEDTEVVHLFGSDIERWLCTWDNEYVSRFTSSEWYVDLGDSISQRGNWSYLGDQRIGLNLDGNLKYILKLPSGGMLGSETDATAQEVFTGYEFKVRFHKKVNSTWQEEEPGELGDCTVDLIHDCLLSPEYPNAYGDDKHCLMSYTGYHRIHAVDFHVGGVYDYLSVHGKKYSGTAGPVNVESRDEMPAALVEFFSDPAFSRRGFQLCEIEGCFYFSSSDACPTDDCTWDGFFCRNSNISNSSSGSNVCMDRDSGKDRDGYDCKFYSANPYMCQYGVFYLDDDEFIARTMCCACGGGDRA